MQSVGGGGDGEEEAAVGSGRGSVGVGGNGDPVCDFVGGSIDDGDARGVLIVGEDVRAVGGDGDALHDLGNGNGSDELAIGDIEDAHAAGVDIRSISSTAIFAEHEHVRFGLAGGDFGDNFARRAINDIDGVGEFGADVEQAIGSEKRLVRAKGLAEVNGGSELAPLEIDDVDRCAVGSGPADAGIAVDGNVGEARIGRDSDLVAVDADGDFGELAAIGG